MHEEHKICHRDLNPNNIIIVEGEGGNGKKVKIIDFNVSTKFQPDQKMI